MAHQHPPTTLYYIPTYPLLRTVRALVKVLGGAGSAGSASSLDFVGLGVELCGNHRPGLF